MEAFLSWQLFTLTINIIYFRKQTALVSQSDPLLIYRLKKQTKQRGQLKKNAQNVTNG